MRTARLSIVLPAARRSLLRLPPRRQHGLGVFTNHESRDTNHGFYAFPETRITRHGFYRRRCARGGAAGNLRPDHCARRQVPVFQFTIVRHSSLLFAIVHHCSGKNIVRSHCPLSVHTGNAACKVFTNHETRVTNHGLYAFHESRDTNHGLSGRPVAAFLRVVARYGAAMARHGRHRAPRAAVRAPSAPATGPFGFLRDTKHKSRNMAFMLFTKHESRPLSPPGRCFPARCGATVAPLWRGYGAAVARVGRLWRWRGMGGRGAAWAAYCPRASVLAPSAFLGRPPGSPHCRERQMNPC